MVLLLWQIKGSQTGRQGGILGIGDIGSGCGSGIAYSDGAVGVWLASTRSSRLGAGLDGSWFALGAGWIGRHLWAWDSLRTLSHMLSGVGLMLHGGLSSDLGSVFACHGGLLFSS